MSDSDNQDPGKKSDAEHLEQWRAAVDALEEPIFLHDPEFRLIQANRAYAREAGMDPVDFLGQPYWEVFPHRDGPLPGCREALQEATERSTEITLDDARVFRSRSSPALGTDGTPLFSVHILADISSQKAREEALQWAEKEQEQALQEVQRAKEKLASLTEASLDAIIMLDDQGLVTLWNPAAEQIFQHSRDRALGADFHRLAVPERYLADFQAGLAHFARTGEGGVVGRTTELTGLRVNGNEFPAEVSISAVQLEGRWYAVGVLRDISERKEAEAELRRRAEGEAMVQTISTDLLAAPYDQIDATIEDALARIGQATAADRSYLFQITDDGRSMSNTHEWTGEGVTPQIQDRQGLSTADFDWFLDQLRQRSALPIRSRAEVPDPGLRALFTECGTRSLLLIPMARQEGLIGFLGLDAVGSERTWSESEQHLLRIAADTLAGALARQRLETELRYQARHDPLTGLLNRRPFEEALAREVHRSQRYDQAFALIMLDIDHFKAVNDIYGHELGDRILEELAEEVSDRLREADLLARWGGEEFMALLPETDAGGAHQVAEAIRYRVAEQDFPGVGQLTVSLGVADYQAYEAVKDVTRRVDEALYVAKEGGRNRVVVDGEEPNT